MNPPIDLVLARLAPFKLHENGQNRWRACCPAHGGSNPSALSVGLGDTGAVMLKCWHGCSADEVASALGLELSDLFPPRESHGVPLKKRALVSAQQCLDVVAFETMLVGTAAFNLANGHALTPDDLQRLAVACGRIQALAAEVRA
jgi:hypothetical protein